MAAEEPAGAAGEPGLSTSCWARTENSQEQLTIDANRRGQPTVGAHAQPGSPRQLPENSNVRRMRFWSRTDTQCKSGMWQRLSLQAGEPAAQRSAIRVPSPGGSMSSRRRRLLKEASLGTSGALPLGGMWGLATERDGGAATFDLNKNELRASYGGPGLGFGVQTGGSVRHAPSRLPQKEGALSSYDGKTAPEEPCPQHYHWCWGPEDYDPPLALDPMEHEWMLIVAEGQYESIIEPLTLDPSLLSRRDFVTGYSAIHWLAKHGKYDDLLKLMQFAEAQGLPVDINARARGGLTPLHIAAMQGHDLLIKVLVGAFSADVHLRDHSGRKAWQYLRANASNELKELSGAPEEVVYNLATFNKNNNSRSSKRASRRAQRGDEVDGGHQRKSAEPVTISPFMNLFRRLRLYLTSEW